MVKQSGILHNRILHRNGEDQSQIHYVEKYREEEANSTFYTICSQLDTVTL